MPKAKVFFTDSSGDTDKHVQKELQESKSSKYTPSIIIFTQIKSMKAGTQRAVIILCKGSTKSYFSVAFTAIRIKANECHCYLTSSTITALW